MREEGLVNIRSGENQDVVARTELYGALEAITSKRCTVTAEVASSSLVVPAILNKPLSNFEARPLWVQNGATLTCVRRSTLMGAKRCNSDLRSTVSRSR